MAIYCNNAELLGGRGDTTKQRGLGWCSLYRGVIKRININIYDTKNKSSWTFKAIAIPNWQFKPSVSSCILDHFMSTVAVLDVLAFKHGMIVGETIMLQYRTGKTVTQKE